ncbi:D(2) dopamine receptor-like isoform X1 [Lytechinus pictus]|uniref:D(2) dopamine receptor-like isoform X1 n=2 Tax=Lytechinus pictus TaxID=7653 RepID=UPI0030B9D54E
MENVTEMSSLIETVPPVEVLAPNYPLLIMICILITVIITGNTLSIITIVSTPSLFNQTGYCLINLAIADLSIGIFYLPFCIPVVITGQWYSTDLFCRVMTSTAICTVIVSITSLALISIDRLVCISVPLCYQLIFSKRRVFSLLLLTWGYGSAMALFSVTVSHFIKFQPFFYNCGIDVTSNNTRPYTIILLTCGFYISLGVIFYCCLRITNISWKAGQKINVQNQVTAREKTSLEETRRQITITARIFVVIVVFLICWGPFAIEMHYGLITRHQFPWQLSVTFEFLAKFNSAMNPFIYMITFAPFRKTFLKRYFPSFVKDERSSIEVKPCSSLGKNSANGIKTVSGSVSERRTFPDKNLAEAID